MPVTQNPIQPQHFPPTAPAPFLAEAIATDSATQLHDPRLSGRVHTTAATPTVIGRLTRYLQDLGTAGVHSSRQIPYISPSSASSLPVRVEGSHGGEYRPYDDGGPRVGPELEVEIVGVERSRLLQRLVEALPEGDPDSLSYRDFRFEEDGSLSRGVEVNTRRPRGAEAILSATPGSPAWKWRVAIGRILATCWDLSGRNPSQSIHSPAPGFHNHIERFGGEHAGRATAAMAKIWSTFAAAPSDWAPLFGRQVRSGWSHWGRPVNTETIYDMVIRPRHSGRDKYLALNTGHANTLEVRLWGMHPQNLSAPHRWHLVTIGVTHLTWRLAYHMAVHREHNTPIIRNELLRTLIALGDADFPMYRDAVEYMKAQAEDLRVSIEGGTMYPPGDIIMRPPTHEEVPVPATLESDSRRPPVQNDEDESEDDDEDNTPPPVPRVSYTGPDFFELNGHPPALQRVPDTAVDPGEPSGATLRHGFVNLDAPFEITAFGNSDSPRIDSIQFPQTNTLRIISVRGAYTRGCASGIRVDGNALVFSSHIQRNLWLYATALNAHYAQHGRRVPVLRGRAFLLLSIAYGMDPTHCIADAINAQAAERISQFLRTGYLGDLLPRLVDISASHQAEFRQNMDPTRVNAGMDDRKPCGVTFIDNISL